MNRRALKDAAQTLENLLVARATGSSASDVDYRQLREELLAEPALRDLVPSFLRTARDLAQFWAYIKKEYGGYGERREHIWDAFRPLLDYLETPEGTAPPAAVAAESLASVVDVASPGPKTTKGFISYSSRDKTTAGLVRALLEDYGIECFVAHDDLQVSEEWKERILEELLLCDIFVPLLSKNFRASDWGAQEIGVVSGRQGIAIVPLSIDGTVPFGFISNIQGRQIPATGPTSDLVISPLLKKFPHLIIPGMIERVRTAGSFRGAEAAVRPLVPHFATLTDAELTRLVDACIENNQVWSAGECRADTLPKLIAATRSRINPAKLTALEYQMEHDTKYYAPSTREHR